jgi:nitrite reductase/ring-hydroxylating ferredoxin subunit
VTGTFGGYDLMDSGESDPVLTRVGRSSPGGEYLRRFWHPIALASELRDLPLALRVLGEELVLFRDGRGELGLLHRRCSHRGASLEFGIIADRGIRCCYHGWVYDVDGTILETPAEPDSQARTTRCHGAYPTSELDGLIFAYLGPPSEKPPFPHYETFAHPSDNELIPFKLLYPCNWLQVHENTADPMHIPFLHGRVSGVQFGPGFSDLPALSFVDTPIGMAVASTRFSDGRVWVRTADLMEPNVAQYPPAFETGEPTRSLIDAWATRWVVPLDDTDCWVIGYRHFNAALDPNAQGCRENIGLEKVDFEGQVAQSAENRQRTPGDFEAMVGQGPITVHAAENLVASDRGVVRLRRRLRNEISRIAEGGCIQSAHETGIPVPTYTAEFIVPAAGDPGPDRLEAIGQGVLSRLLETREQAPEIRAKQIERWLLEEFSWL